jgi:hypothetical protein
VGILDTRQNQDGDIPAAGARVVKTTFGNVAVFRTAADDLFAIEDR